jgi:hypothetical protein
MYISVTQLLGTQEQEHGSFKVKTKEYSYIYREDSEVSTHGCI